ncbi:hypothetical protein [Flavobacterium aquatile]|uniref:Uncharacterized protein n=1 Tax=Flavobacterium aquatile LMG 4008 = ATCC 11947 TaxID=1453498 RepID=A0A095V428_9FLAO|nr:hypothetical protein [Flavobacterium aquatile]KGD69595.1 hypothetical protein LG45_02210 [Flavobacterium aquatile LMG 4008 = ATCC 11947]OXA67269.1 hypothetical protein B0A61_08670 [Flavobacterium aquatile LMG 4008 = ATCC 11947]GEC77928.1 hypothetical protein FAQ01_07980 [Flavobacterium aquatile]
MADVEVFVIQEAIEKQAKKDVTVAGILSYGHAKGVYAARQADAKKSAISKNELRKKVIIFSVTIILLCFGIYFLQPYKTGLFLASMFTIALSVFAAFELYDTVKKAGAITVVIITTFFVLLASGKYTLDEIAEFGRKAADEKVLGTGKNKSKNEPKIDSTGTVNKP